jgi:capsular polysaccharide biosynthesis protein
MSVKQYVQMLLSGWWIISGMTLIAAGIAPFYSYSQPDVYASSASFVGRSRVLTNDPRDLIDSLGTLAARTTVISTFCEILDSDAMLTAAAQRLSLTEAAVDDYSTDCVVLTDSTVVKLTVQGPSPNLAADLANTIGLSGIEYISQLQEIYDLQGLDPAVPNTSPVAPNHQFDMIIAVLIGFVGGCVLTFVNWRLSTPDLSQGSIRPANVEA